MPVSASTPKELGLEVIEAGPGYARLRSPGGDGTMGLHAAGRGIEPPWNDGVRLYFEVDDLDGLCARLAAAGVAFRQPPQDMEWGWRHAYLSDPDGHDISLFSAGEKRFQPSPRTAWQGSDEG